MPSRRSAWSGKWKTSVVTDYGVNSTIAQSVQITLGLQLSPLEMGSPGSGDQYKAAALKSHSSCWLLHILHAKSTWHSRGWV